MDTRSASKRWTGRLLATVVTVLIGIALAVPEADARRFGGGRSFGRQSPNATRPAQPPAQEANRQAPQQAQPQNGVQPPRNRWLGPLAGLAAGLGIAALLSHFGMMGPLAEVFGSMLLIGLLIVAALVVWRLLRGSRAGPAGPVQRGLEPAYQSQGGGFPASQTPGPATYDNISAGARPGSVAALSGADSAQQPGPAGAPGVPADFDVPGFLRNAKVYFLRLQAAWDARDLADIREFTTPEVFAEIKMQIDERKGETDRTEVSDLDAQLLGIEEGPDGYLASVRFTGRMSETANLPPEPFEEVWNLAKPRSGRTGWLLAGIQQVH
jgi:predicted lipid-binding transport protein (Tim44 family)